MPKAVPLRELTLEEQRRFWSKVDVRSATECWPWLRAVFQRTGYGMFALKPRTVLAHRVAFKLAFGYEPPPEMKLDHTCDMRICCNPWHLEPKTDVANISRGMAPSSVLARERKCAKGHDLTKTGRLMQDKGVLRLRCAVCKAARNAARPSRAKAA